MPPPRPLDLANPRRAVFLRRTSSGSSLSVQREPRPGRSPGTPSTASPFIRPRAATSLGPPPCHPRLGADDAPELATDLLRRVEREHERVQRELETCAFIPGVDSADEVEGCRELNSPAARSGSQASSSVPVPRKDPTACTARATSAEHTFATARSVASSPSAAPQPRVPPSPPSNGRPPLPSTAAELAALHRRVTELSELRERAEKRANDAENTAAEVRQGVALYGEKVRQRKQELRERIQRLEEANTGLTQRCSSVEEERDRLEEANSVLTQQRASVEGERDQLRAELDAMRRELASRSHRRGRKCQLLRCRRRHPAPAYSPCVIACRHRARCLTPWIPWAPRFER
eukprot:Hpha_TRINITY_DN11578_c0_g1::TRINITY_DN11578_c0_g1_i2::g.32331::m.32331